ncbi:hypothetical protein TsocGM_14600 [Tautonia sociabilis]|uniref:Uncharacterized protein n=1 Tax=Tautonia sociabilis TaxID=2080755 RepID=A0A432MIM2_9BACT|nr:hypothetical protein TsocGM_14600 [Tautonia sociabilis]
MQLTPKGKAYYHDAAFNAESVAYTYNPPRLEPHMELYGPYTGRFLWQLYRAIDWTHVHHGETYDILSSRQIDWDRKKEWTDRQVRYYLELNDRARSPAPLDVTMRRANVMMKPYFGIFRSLYPQSTTYFYVAHWWHPAIYEAMMLGGNDEEQDEAVRETHEQTFSRVFHDRPSRMLLSREMMPRYSRLSPESANIFDNLHMIHGIAYAILAYEGWDEEQKRAEMYRVLDALGYQPGDEELARKFSLPYPDMDPRCYEGWMKGYEGEMNRIMEEMLREMWPGMSADGSSDPPPNVMHQLRLKLSPGYQPGEHPGSLHQALMKEYPQMKMDKEGMAPGKASEKMVRTMIKGWSEKYGNMPEVPPIAMTDEPSLRPAPCGPEERHHSAGRR